MGSETLAHFAQAEGFTVAREFVEVETADSDEAGQAFQFEAGHPFRFEAGQRSDLMSATIPK